MKTNLIHRSTSLLMATLITLALFGSIDHLAGIEEASGVWAAAVMAPRG